jgi:hypothetical protein
MSEMSRGLYQCPSCYGPSMGPGQCVKCLEDTRLYAELRRYMAQHSVGVEAAMKYMQEHYQDTEAAHLVPFSYMKNLIEETYGVEHKEHTMAIQNKPQRRTVRKPHLDASVIPVERAYIARAEALEKQETPEHIGGTYAAKWLAEQFRLLAEELHYW